MVSKCASCILLRPYRAIDSLSSVRKSCCGTEAGEMASWVHGSALVLCAVLLFPSPLP